MAHLYRPLSARVGFGFSNVVDIRTPLRSNTALERYTNRNRRSFGFVFIGIWHHRILRCFSIGYGYSQIHGKTSQDSARGLPVALSRAYECVGHLLCLYGR